MADGTNASPPHSTSFENIEIRIRYLQLQLWNERREIWPTNTPDTPLDVLQPGVALRILGYQLESAHALEETFLRGDAVQIAGEIDPERKIVRISSRYSKDEQLFTAAHELTHVLLNHNLTAEDGKIHRDRSFGSRSQVSTSRQEREADWGAACFLMPRRIVTQKFFENFRTVRFTLNDDTAFSLCTKSIDAVIARYRTQRDISFLLSTSIAYGGVAIAPLHRIFGVSPKAMAIMLEQYNLIATV